MVVDKVAEVECEREYEDVQGCGDECVGAGTQLAVGSQYDE